MKVVEFLRMTLRARPACLPEALADPADYDAFLCQACRRLRINSAI